MHDLRILRSKTFKRLGSSDAVSLRRDRGKAVEAASLVATVHDDRVVVDASIASHTSHADIEVLEPREVVNLVIFGVAATVALIGHAQTASPLFETVLTAELFNPDMTELAACLIADGDGIECAHRIAEHWCRIANKAEELAPAVQLLATVCSSARARQPGKRRDAAALLERIGETVLQLSEGSQNKLAAAAFLSAARIFSPSATGTRQTRRLLAPALLIRRQLHTGV